MEKEIEKDGYFGMLNPEECKTGECERCNTEDVLVVADGYFMGFICEKCFEFVHGIYR